MTAFEQRLKRIFEAQDFFGNPRIDSIIGSAIMLPDDELERFAAAGDPSAAGESQEGLDDGKR